MNVPVLPPIFQDEPVAFYLQRVKSLHGAFSERYIQKHMFGASWRIPSAFHPRGLEQLSSVIGEHIGLPVADDFLWHHTNFPFSSLFLSSQNAVALRQRILTPSFGPASQGGWPGFVLKKIVRICTQCAQEALKRHGFFTISRNHLVPFVSRCHLHGVLLIELLSCDFVTVPVEKITAVNTQSKMTGVLSRLSFSIMNRSAAVGRAELKTWIRNGLEKLGYLTSKSSLRLAKLVPDMVTIIGPDLESHALKTALMSSTLAAELSKCVATDKNIHPGTTLLLAMLIFSKNLEVDTMERPRRRTQVEMVELEPAIIMALKCSSTLSNVASAFNLSVTTVATIARKNNVAFQRKPHVLLPALEKVVETALRAGMTPPAVAREYGLSLSSIYRLKSFLILPVRINSSDVNNHKLQNSRSRWCIHIEKSKLASRSELRHAAPALWTWLYRNDKKWLMEHVPVRHKSGGTKNSAALWRNREHTLIPKVFAALSTMREADGPRITSTSIFLRAGACFVSKADLENMPKLKLIIDKEIESKSVFVKRRLQAALKALSACERISTSALIKKSRLRTETVMRYGITPVI